MGTTLDPFSTQTKQERVRVNRRQMIGSTFENLGRDIYESILGVPASFESREAIKTDVAGRGLDMSSSHTDFQRGRSKTPDVAKSPELLKLEEEAIRKRQHFSRVEADLNNARNFAHTSAVDELAQQVATMSTEERNQLYNIQGSANRQLTENIHAKTSIGKAIQEERQQKQTIEANPVQPQKSVGGFEVGENDLINNEAQGWRNNPG